MTEEYEIGKDIGDVRARLDALEQRGKDCTGSRSRRQKTSSELSPEEVQRMSLLGENALRLKTGIEELLTSLGIQPEGGERLSVHAISIGTGTASDHPISPWGPVILACCTDGTTGVCFQAGCDPCA